MFSPVLSLILKCDYRPSFVRDSLRSAYICNGLTTRSSCSMVSRTMAQCTNAYTGSCPTFHFSRPRVLLVGSTCLSPPRPLPTLYERHNVSILALVQVQSLITSPEFITFHILDFLQGQALLELVSDVQGTVMGTSRE